MRPSVIRKSVSELRPPPNLIEYERERSRLLVGRGARRVVRLLRARNQHRRCGDRPASRDPHSRPRRLSLRQPRRPPARHHVRRARAPDQSLRQRAARRWASAGTTTCSCWPAGCRNSTSPSWARSRTARSHVRCSPRSARNRSGRASRSAKARYSSRRKRSTGARSWASTATFPSWSTCSSIGENGVRTERTRHSRLRDPDGRGIGRLRGRADRRRGPRAPPFHERHDGDAQGRAPRPRRGRHAFRDRPLRARSPPGRRLLVHRRSGLGHRDVVRHHRAAAAWRDEPRRRSGFRRRALVRPAAGSRHHGLVHGADGDPHADEGGRGHRAQVSASRAAVRRERRRAAQSRGGMVGRRGAGDCRYTTTGGRPRPAAS